MISTPCPIYTIAKKTPEAIAIQDGSDRITYKDLDQLIQDSCQKISFKPSSKMALSVSTNTDSIIQTFSFFRLGIITLLLDYNLSETEVKTVLKRTKIKSLFSKDLYTNNKKKTTHTTIPLSDPISIIATSGSSGAPKLLLHSAYNHLASATSSQEKIPLGLDDKWGLSLPLHHVSGLSILWRCFQVGATVVLPPKENPLLYFLNHCTHLSLVPTQLQDLLNLPKTDHHLKHVLVGGAYCSEELLSKGRELRLPLQATYGLSEMSSQVCTQKLNHIPLSTMGSSLPGIRMKLGLDGTINLKGPSLFLGYLNDDGAIDPARDERGWFHSNDTGILCESGLKITGRNDRCFISGGENIDPFEIETVLNSHPNINRSYIIPIEHERFGVSPVAIIVLKDFLKKEDIQTFLKDKLSSFKHPKNYKFLNDPEKLSLKPSLKELKTLFEESYD